jgi:hypothetical protein
MRKGIVAFVWVMGAAALAQAGPLAPTRPSQLVSLQASTPDPLCGGFGRPFSTRVTSDGQFELGFVVPEKQVLVVTGVDWAVFGANPSATTLVSLGTNGGASFFIGSAQADAGGTAGGAASFSHTIRPGTTICISTIGVDSINATLHGFLAKDR